MTPPPPPLSPGRIDAVRGRIEERHKSERRSRLAAAEESIRLLKRAIRDHAAAHADALRAHALAHNAELVQLAARLSLAEGAVRYLQQEMRQDDTTVRLPALP